MRSPEGNGEFKATNTLLSVLKPQRCIKGLLTPRQMNISFFLRALAKRDSRKPANNTQIQTFWTQIFSIHFKITDEDIRISTVSTLPNMTSFTTKFTLYALTASASFALAMPVASPVPDDATFWARAKVGYNAFAARGVDLNNTVSDGGFHLNNTVSARDVHTANAAPAAGDGAPAQGFNRNNAAAGPGVNINKLAPPLMPVPSPGGDLDNGAPSQGVNTNNAAAGPGGEDSTAAAPGGDMGSPVAARGVHLNNTFRARDEQTDASFWARDTHLNLTDATFAVHQNNSAPAI
ncbi:hypothetical protein EJ03DRAFT_150399 [Teratosphaeria nubilosa]|uniref:Uncharacterized protein n=1 Tax=Teratosphaeria nubilosa TaxID=161662 RepID=A0A6G1LLC1_9PEZI|nr:hypothetical protein EJ03DRAFT_150399 [Teratosphaeria nubilosa]